METPKTGQIDGSSISISVVIPFYHAERFFEQALASVRQQSYAPEEILVVNDGCGAEAQRFLQAFDDIRVIELEHNRGAAAARNAGIEAASHDWIAFLDADDLWLPDKLERQVAFLSANPLFDACHTGITVFNEQGDLCSYLDKPRDLQVADLLESSHVTPPSLLIRKQVLERVGLFDERIRCSEDYDLSMRLVAAGVRIGFLDQPLTRVRRMSHGNLSSSAWSVFIGHIQFLVKHWALFRAHKGAVLRYLYRTLMTAGGKSTGISQRLYFLLGRCMRVGFPQLKQLD